MARLIPQSRPDRIRWFGSHVDIWLDDPPAIGLDPAQAIAVQKKVNDAVAALQSAHEAQLAARAAVARFHQVADDLYRTGGSAVATIKAFAQSENDSTILTRAQLDLPNHSPRPLPAPPSATHFIGRVLVDGSIRLSWQGSLSGGTYFTIERSLIDAHHQRIEPFRLIDSTQSKNYRDRTLPIGYYAASYRVTAHRGNQSSPPREAMVRFGTPGNKASAARLAA